MAGTWMTWWASRPPPGEEAWQDYQATYAWFLGLQLLDLLSTFAVLGLGGGEGNPVANAQWSQGGAFALVAFKLALVLLTVAVWLPALAWLMARPEPTRRWALPAFHAGVVGCVILYTLVVYHNLRNVAALLDAPAS